MRNHRINKPIKNFQKKKYYTNRNMPKTKEPQTTYYYDPLKREWGTKTK